MSEQTEQTENNLQPLTEHLKALRRVFLISLIAVFVSSILCYGFLREPIMSLVTAPMAAYDFQFLPV